MEWDRAADLLPSLCLRVYCFALTSDNFIHLPHPVYRPIYKPALFLIGSNRPDDQLSSLDLVAESEEQANTLVGLLNRLVVQCQDERTVSTAACMYERAKRRL